MKKCEIETILSEDDSPFDVAPKKNNISFRDAAEARASMGSELAIDLKAHPHAYSIWAQSRGERTS